MALQVTDQRWLRTVDMLMQAVRLADGLPGRNGLPARRAQSR